MVNVRICESFRFHEYKLVIVLQEAPGSLEKRFCQDELDGPPFAVPKEIWRLVDHLNKHGIQQVNV